MSETYQRDTTIAWVLALLDQYDEIRETTPTLANLRPPNFHLSEDVVAKLGTWDEERRVMMLAARLFRYCNWADVVTVLKHEMAHQIVSEVFGVRNAPPHGPEFARACQLLGIDPVARARLEEFPTGETENPVARRVEKLLALGQSPNRHEAEAALVKAQELALKYNLEDRQRPATCRYAFRVVGPLFRRVPSYLWYITGILESFYFVQHICRTCPDVRGELFKFIELYGARDSLDMAEYVFCFLLHEGERQWWQYCREKGYHDHRQRLSFLKGLYRGFEQKLAAQRAAVRAEYALVYREDPALTAFYHERNPRVHHRTMGRTNWYADAHAAGQEAGQRLHLRPGLNRNPEARQERLLGE